jgi:hypothetical protein
MRQRNLHLLITVMFLVLAALLLRASQSDHPLLYMLVASLFIVTMIPFARSIGRGPIDWFKPIYPVGFLYFVYFGAYTIYALQNPDYPGRLGDYSIYGLNLAVTYTILGFTCLLIGYYSSLPRKLSRRLSPLKFSPPANRVIPLVYAIYALGTILRLILVSRGWHIKYNAGAYFHEVPAGFYIIDYLTALCTFSYMLAVIYYFTGLRQHGFVLTLWAVILPLELVFAFLGGAKAAFLPIIFAPLVAYHYFKRRLSVRHLLIPVLLMIFVVTPLLTTYRMIDAPELRSKGFVGGLLYSVDHVASDVRSYSLGEYAQFSYEAFMERVNGSGAFSLVIEGVPERMDFQYGKTMFVTLALLVPTFLWPGKYEFYQNVLTWDDLIFEKRGMGGIAITQIGELYLNFHLFGIIMGMFVLGVFYRFVHLYFTKDRNPVGVFIFMNLWLAIIFIEFPFAAAYANMFKQVSILLVIAWLVNRGRLFDRLGRRSVSRANFLQRMGEVMEGRPTL